MLAGLRKIPGWLARHWGFPANFQWWWLLLGLPSVPALVGGIITFLQNASWLVIALVILGSYVVALGGTALILRRWTASRSVVVPHAGTTDSVHTETPQTEVRADTHRHPQQGQDETYEVYLRRLCRELAQELYRFLNERGYSRSESHDDPRIEQRDAEALASPQYREYLRPRARNLLKKLKSQGLYPPEGLASHQQRPMENPRSLWRVELLADMLNEIGHDW